MTVLDCRQAREMLLFCADEIVNSKPLLTEVDSKIGDGDHGIGMALGMTKAREKIAAMENCEDIYRLFTECGKAMLMNMGGASGVIFGTMFMGGAKGKEPVKSMDTRMFAALMQESLAAVKSRGKAEVGDKTMVDALEPAVAAMTEYSGDDFYEMLSAAQQAAQKGVEYTKQLTAKYGRAKFLGERAVGFQDAGATSVWLIFRAMAEYVKTA